MTICSNKNLSRSNRPLRPPAFVKILNKGFRNNDVDLSVGRLLRWGGGDGACYVLPIREPKNTPKPIFQHSSYRKSERLYDEVTLINLEWKQQHKSIQKKKIMIFVWKTTVSSFQSIKAMWKDTLKVDDQGSLRVNAQHMDHISRFIIAVTHDHLVQTAAKCYLHILWIAWGDHFHLMWITRLYRIHFVQIVSGC